MVPAKVRHDLLEPFPHLEVEHGLGHQLGTSVHGVRDIRPRLRRAPVDGTEQFVLDGRRDRAADMTSTGSVVFDILEIEAFENVRSKWAG